ncbi:MAG: hypothetical protein V3W37_08150 [Candidatus Binatia bacterium]
MSDYRPEHTTYTGPVNVMMRLTPRDTEFLRERIEQAIEGETGVNLIFTKFRGALSLTHSPERGRQIKCIGYGGASGVRVESEMRGYHGKWSHVELAFPPSVLTTFQEFLDDVEAFP